MPFEPPVWHHDRQSRRRYEVQLDRKSSPRTIGSEVRHPDPPKTWKDRLGVHLAICIGTHVTEQDVTSRLGRPPQTSASFDATATSPRSDCHQKTFTPRGAVFNCSIGVTSGTGAFESRERSRGPKAIRQALASRRAGAGIVKHRQPTVCQETIVALSGALVTGAVRDCGDSALHTFVRWASSPPLSDRSDCSKHATYSDAHPLSSSGAKGIWRVSELGGAGGGPDVDGDGFPRG